MKLMGKIPPKMCGNYQSFRQPADKFMAREAVHIAQ